MRASERLQPAAAELIRAAIADAGGREVLFVGRLDGGGLVGTVEVAGRGDEGMVPAFEPQLEKGDVILHNHPSGRLSPSPEDLSVASQLGRRGVGFFIVDNQVELVYVVAEPIAARALKKIDGGSLAGLLEPGGRLAGRLEHYEERREQLAMLEAVAAAFNDGAILAVEAGTGVGKSLAYLIPAMHWCAANEERVVVSTATINLQEQLVGKDIPMLKRLLGLDVPSVLVKGRGNYLCLNRLREALDEQGLFQEPGSQLAALADWAKSTPSGDRAELPFMPADELWADVCSEADACTGLRCSFREGCFVLRLRREAAAARLLVVNHHLLFSDLALRAAGAGFEATAVLPPFQRLVLDEAHNLESNATSYFSEQLSRLLVHKLGSRLLRVRAGRRFGLLERLVRLPGLAESCAKAAERLAGLRAAAEALDGAAARCLGEGASLRFSPESPAALSEELKTCLLDFQRLVSALLDELEAGLRRLDDEAKELPEVYETRQLLRRYEGLAALSGRFLNASGDPEQVYWLDRRRTLKGEAYVQFIRTPLAVGAVMRESVFSRFSTIILTSATLSIAKDFSYWMGRIGLRDFNENEVRELALPSPFDYRQRVFLGVPEDAPLPDEESYLDFLAGFLKRAILISEGKALVLFTSYADLLRTCEAVKPDVEKLGIPIFRQGDDERSRLLDRFNRDVSSVLFATDSFWEGVDAPGETLSLLVICRLPFRVPTDPILVARMEALRREGGNPFMQLSLPEAVIKFRQGFGRLMRRTTDRGCVLVPDARLVRRPYGSVFLASVPQTRRSLKSSDMVLEDMEAFLYEKKAVRKDRFQ